MSISTTEESLWRPSVREAGFRRVLIGFDGSERAADALSVAQRMLDPRAGVLSLACVEPSSSFRTRLRGRAPDAGELLDAGRLRVAAEVAVTELVWPAASVARGLTELAEREHADLVVVGSSRAAPEGRTWPGSTALRLLQNAPCAIAVAPVGSREAGRFRHVGIAYDGSREAAAALAAGYGLAASHAAAVSIYCVIPAQSVAAVDLPAVERERIKQRPRLEAQELLDAAADAAPAGVNPRTVLLYGDCAHAITAAADGIIDVLFTGSRGHGPLHRVFSGSVSEALLQLATQPVVVTPRSGRTAAAPERAAA